MRSLGDFDITDKPLGSFSDCECDCSKCNRKGDKSRDIPGLEDLVQENLKKDSKAYKEGLAKICNVCKDPNNAVSFFVSI